MQTEVDDVLHAQLLRLVHNPFVARYRVGMRVDAAPGREHRGEAEPSALGLAAERRQD